MFQNATRVIMALAVTTALAQGTPPATAGSPSSRSAWRQRRHAEARVRWTGERRRANSPAVCQYKPRCVNAFRIWKARSPRCVWC